MGDLPLVPAWDRVQELSYRLHRERWPRLPSPLPRRHSPWSRWLQVVVSLMAQPTH